MNLTNEQIAAIQTTGVNLCVDAGAGSGKTRVLVERILYLIENRLADLDRIVAITFTENAAAEMKERLRRECRKRAPLDDPERMSFWRDVERRVESARISTIHGFCSRLLRENALQLGLDPDFVVLPETESHLLRREAVTTALHRLLEEEDPAAVRVASVVGLRRLQKNLRSMLDRPGIVEAIGRRFPMDGPEALRVEWLRLIEECRRRRLLELGRSPELRRFQRALRSFANRCLEPSDAREKLRVEMLLHIDAILAGADAPTVEKHIESLADSTAGRPLRRNWDSPETYDALKTLQENVQKFARGLRPASVDPAREQLAAELACDFYAILRKAVDEYDRIKGEENALDFEDLILRALKMLRDTDAIRARTARGIRHLLIDEFQDTDAVQFEIASLLTQEEEGPELFIVGDAKQSIYYFRGAEVEVFQKARVASGRVIPLARNFRSVPEVVRFVNDVFGVSGLLGAVEPEYHGMEAHRDPCGECRVEFLLPEMPEEKSRKSDLRDIEATLIAARLAEMGGSDPVTVCDKETGRPRPANFGDVAILFRSMTDIYTYERRLRDWGIPYTVAAGSGFYERQEIIDLRNLLTLIVDPWDEMALLGFLRSSMVGLSDESLLRLRGWGDTRRGLAHAFNTGIVPENADDAERLEAARGILGDLRVHRELPLVELLRRTLDLTGYEAILLGQSFLGTQKASNVRKLLDLALDFSRTRPPRLGAFLRYLEEAATQEVREGEAALAAEGVGAVTLMTIHKAKGLEFPIVVVPDLARAPQSRSSKPVIADRDLGLAARAPDEEGELKTSAFYDAVADLQQRRELAEGARVLYVAMTRARDWLILSSVPGEKNISHSWFETLLEQYDLLRRADGETFGGNGWLATVRRRADHRRVPRRPADRDVVPDLAALEARVNPVSAGPPQRRLFGVTDVLNCFPKAEASEPAPARPYAIDPKTRGIMLHLLFQQWDLKSPVRPLAEGICRKHCPILGVRAEVVADLVAVAERFQRTELARRIAAQKALQREQSFVLRAGDSLMNGVIDLILDDGTLVDYKTGRHTPESRERYERQLLLYALAHADIRGAVPPAAYLVYVDEDLVVPVEITPERLEETRRLAEQALVSLRQ